MTEVPERVRDLLAEREAARREKEFARADAIRGEILGAGFLLRDTPDGPVLERAPRFPTLDPAQIPSALGEPPALEFSLQVLSEGFPSDLARFLAGLERHNDLAETELVIVDNASPDGGALEDTAAAHAVARVVHLDREVGWAAARNAGLKGARGRIVVLVDLSIEPAGDVLSPLARAFEDPRVGVAGPFGLVSQDMRRWAEARGPEVDAIEGYFLATRRELLAKELICERFRWYRNADIDLSFQLRSFGYRAARVDLPVARHTHRGWSALDDQEREKRSKRNHYIFFDRWKHHHDLLTSHRRAT